MGAYVDIGPVHTWYETRGTGEPLLLLHGGLDTNASWGALSDELARYYRVVAPERRGHGHTPDVDGPLTYDLMAADTAAFVDRVVSAPVHLVGWSDGAVVAMLVAIARPDLVRKLVLIGGNADVSGMLPQVRESARLPADSEAFQPFRAVYGVTSPDGPAHWPVVFAKITRMWQSEPHIPLRDLASIRARTLVLVGDDDVVTPEHTLEIYRALPDAELAVVPGTSHLALMEKPQLVCTLLLDFLRHDPVRTVFPVRRATASLPAS